VKASLSLSLCKTVAAEGGRRCRDENANRARVFETRDSGAGVVAVAFAPLFSVSETYSFLATADENGVVSIWSVPSGTQTFRLDATCRDGSGATSEARTERKSRDGKKETSSDASSVVSLVWGPVSGDGELRLVATTERGDATLWRFASNVSSEDEGEDTSPTSESVLRLKATHGLVVVDDVSSDAKHAFV
jgi:hypothetical protein